MSIRLAISHPLRPPDCRYQRALLFAAAGERPQEAYEDEATRSLIGFLRKLQGCRNTSEVSVLINQQPDVGLAFDIYADSEGDSKLIVEARMLAGEDDETIAEKTGVSREVIEQYAELFYDVEDRLGNSDYIYGSVLKRGATDAGGFNHEALLKHIAYQGGSGALNLVLRTPRHIEEQAENDPMDELNWSIAGLFAAKTLAAVETMDVTDERSVRTLLSCFTQQQAARAEQGIGSPTEQQYVKNVKACMAQIPWSMAKRTDPPSEYSWLPPEAELRADDHLRLVAGMTIDKEKYLRRSRISETDQPGDNGPSDG